MPGALNSCLTEDDAKQGAAVWALLRAPSAYAHRRVESVYIRDETTARREVSIDFTVGSNLLPEPFSAALPGLPLTFLKKEVLKRFDLYDAAGTSLPMLTKAQNGRVVGNALVYTAETRIQRDLKTDEPLPAAMEETLRMVVEGSPGEADGAYQQIKLKAADHPDEHQQAWEVVINSSAVRAALSALRDNFVLIAVAPTELDQRRLLKFGYDEQLTAAAGNRTLRSIGWEAERLVFEAPAVALAQSYHLEIPAPEDLDILDGKMRFESLHDEAPTRAPPNGAPAGETTPDLHFNFSDVDPGYGASADIALRAERRGFVSATALVGALVFVLLLGGRFRLNEISNPQQNQVAAGLLLLAPAIIAAFVIRPGEHRLATRLLSGVRAILVVTIGCAIGAVGLLAGRFDGDALCVAWTTFTVVAGIAAFALAKPALWAPSIDLDTANQDR